MAILHNNPKAKFGPRMPVILSKGSENDWLVPYDEKAWDEQKENLKGLIKSYPQEELDYYTVDRLRGKAYAGNTPKISEHFEYSEFEIDYSNWGK